MKIFILLATLTAAGANHDWHWETFKATQGKRYSNEHEEQFRRMVFDKNFQAICKHNQEVEMGLHSYTRDWNNKFSDQTPDELTTSLSSRTGFHANLRPTQNSFERSNSPTFLPPPSNVDLPDEVDWRKLGAVTPVKDQGQCGSCWAFGATGTLEGMQFRKTGKLVSLSEEQLIDCTIDNEYKMRACLGGDTEVALTYIKDNGGLDTEESYPYLTKEIPKNLICRFRNDTVGAVVKDVVKVKYGDEEDLKAAVAILGPVAVAIDGWQENFLQYKSGVYYDKNCTLNLNHAVLVVGYGHDADVGMDFWIVKNSWGADWGEEGYVRMARNRENHCSIATRAVYPVV